MFNDKKRIVFLTDYNFVTAKFFREFYKLNQGHETMVVSLRSFDETLWDKIIKSSRSFGIRRTLKHLWLYFKDIAKGSPFFIRKNTTYLKFNKIKDNQNLVEKILGFEPDILLSVSCPQIIDIKKFPNMKLMNIHCGLLPKYKGLMPIFWQLLEGEKKIYTCFHEMSEKVDQGKVFHVFETDIGSKTLEHLMYETKISAAREFYFNILDDKFAPIQIPKEENYYSFPQKHHVKELIKKRGFI